MACSKNLYDDLLGGTPGPGGEWTFQSTGPTSFLVNGLPVSLSNGNTVGVNHLVDIDVSDTPTGTYIFRYTIEGSGIGCSAFADVNLIVVAGAVAGTDTSFTLCNTTNQDYNLFNLVRGGSSIPATGPALAGTQAISTTGTWSGTGIASTGYTAGTSSPTDDTFNPNGVPVNPGLVFTYTVEQGTDPLICPNCKDVRNVTFVIVAAPDAGLTANVTLCNDTPA
jgi:hypothetical protein